MTGSQERGKYTTLIAFAERDVRAVVRNLSRYRPEDVSEKKTLLVDELNKAKANLQAQKDKLKEYDQEHPTDE